MMARNFIFDLDGTLVDSLPGIEFAVNAALARTHRPQRVQNLARLIGPPIRPILEGITGAAGEDLDNLEQNFRYVYDTQGWLRTGCYPGVREMLASLRQQNNRMFVATNKPRNATEKILKMLSLRNYFEAVVTPDGRQPPFQGKSEMLAWLVSLHELDVQDSIMIGDTVEDHRAATGLGMSALIITHGYGGSRICSELPNCRRITQFSQITSDSVYLTGVA